MVEIANPRSQKRDLGHPFLRVVLLSLMLPATSTWAEVSLQSALSSALKGTPAVGVVLDRASEQQVAVVGAATMLSTPGSILKPLFLAAALEQREVLPQTTVFCRRPFHLNDGTREWNLDCTHPPSQVPFAAREALAYSCNRYFAQLADRIPPAQAAAILSHYGLARPLTIQNREQKQLLVLGLSGILVSPAQMAIAYRRLALQFDRPDLASTLDPVRRGLEDSVSYGMAHNAAVPGMAIAGKTGTAADSANGSSHGWFAGTAVLCHRKIVIVIYLPHGNGADAARLAQGFLRIAAKTP
jgi:cell division protein FtsI/penicillin-binding protein 2